MELKLRSVFGVSFFVTVLIVPFMELKRNRNKRGKTHKICLNRTFYGIETCKIEAEERFLLCLNRTFYGIETSSVPCITNQALLS